MTSLRWDNVPKPRVERPPLLASSSKSTRRKQKPPNLKDRIEEVGGARTELQDLSRSANAAARTRLRLRALHVMGHGSARIARALGVREETIQRLVRGDARTISPPLRDAIAGLYDAWWDKRAPERTRAESAAAARPKPRQRRELVRRRRPGRRPTRHHRLPPPHRLPPGHRHRRRHRHPPARPPALQEEGRVTDHRMNLDLITDMFGLLDRHGYTRGDNEHTGRAMLLLGDLARIYEGSQDHPFGPLYRRDTAAAGTRAARTGPPRRRRRAGRPGQDPHIRPDHRRRLQARPRRTVRRRRRPVLPDLRVAPAGRPGL